MVVHTSPGRSVARPVALQMDTLNFVHSMTWCPKFLYLKDMAVPQCWWMVTVRLCLQSLPSHFFAIVNKYTYLTLTAVPASLAGTS